VRTGDAFRVHCDSHMNPTTLFVLHAGADAGASVQVLGSSFSASRKHPRCLVRKRQPERRGRLQRFSSPAWRQRLRRQVLQAQVELPQVRIVGAGLAGLTTAIALIEEYGWDPASVSIFEASDTVGGRVRTDRLPEGYLLDRGFQVVLEAYPEQKRLFRVTGAAYPDELKLRRFLPGATVCLPNGTWAYVGDPLRSDLGDVWTTLLAPLGTIQDKARVGWMRLQTQLRYTSNPNSILEQVNMNGNREETAEEALTALTPGLRQSFFSPFYRGIFLDELYNISSRLFRYVYHMLAVGYASLPDNGHGIGALPRFLAQRLRDEHGLTIHYGQRVTDLSTLADRAVLVLAADVASTKKLLEQASVANRFSPKAQADIRKLLCGWLAAGADGVHETLQRVSTCLYFGGEGAEPPEALITRPRSLVLAADAPSPPGMPRRPLVNNLCFPSAVARSYAPSNKYLVSCTVVETALHQQLDPKDNDLLPGGELEALVRTQLYKWYPSQRHLIDDWSFLRGYRVRGAQPRQRLNGERFVMPNEDGCLDAGRLYVCGDWCDTPTANGAIHSGYRVAGGIAKAFGVHSRSTSSR